MQEAYEEALEWQKAGMKQEYMVETECDYCGSIIRSDRCTSCGAPRTK